MSAPASPASSFAALGLGCSRIGSLLGASSRDGEALIKSALDLGISLFDTAPIYGQGESERVLGRALRAEGDQVAVVSKAGQYFSWPMRLAIPLKRMLRPIIGMAPATRGRVSRARAGLLPQDFSEPFLRQSVEGSIRRLGRERIDIMLLHSPPVSVIREGFAIGVLDTLRREGKVGRIGISCDTIDEANAALGNDLVAVLEIPVWPRTDALETALRHARERQVFVIARGLGDFIAASRTDPAGIRDAVRAAAATPGIDRLLVGTTSPRHLAESIAALAG